MRRGAAWPLNTCTPSSWHLNERHTHGLGRPRQALVQRQETATTPSRRLEEIGVVRVHAQFGRRLNSPTQVDRNMIQGLHDCQAPSMGAMERSRTSERRMIWDLREVTGGRVYIPGRP